MMDPKQFMDTDAYSNSTYIPVGIFNILETANTSNNKKEIDFQNEIDRLREQNEALKKENTNLRNQVRSLTSKLRYYKDTNKKRIKNPKRKNTTRMSISSYDRKRFALRKALKENPNVSFYFWVTTKQGSVEPITLNNISNCTRAFFVKNPFDFEVIF